jgi:hypothetical protein
VVKEFREPYRVEKSGVSDNLIEASREELHEQHIAQAMRRIASRLQGLPQDRFLSQKLWQQQDPARTE